MGGSGWGHIIRAIGLAVVGGEDEAPASAPRAQQRSNPFARKKGCCNAKRGAAPASAAPVAGAQFDGVRPVRPGRRK